MQNIRFVRNLSLNTSCKFHYDDVTVTSVINVIDRWRRCCWKHPASCYSFSVAKRAWW